MPRQSATPLTRALALLGPLEGRIMREVWTGGLGEAFAVRDVRARMPELAYTTVMTTLVRLADKGLLETRSVPGQRAHQYRPALSPGEALERQSRQKVEQMVEDLGEAALAAFAARLESLSPERRERLRRLARP